MRVLLIDDDEDTLVTMAKLLDFAGHETRVAVNGEDAFHLMTDFRPETVLLDLWLPNMDGFEVARRLRELSADDPLRIIAITGAKIDWAKDQGSGIDYHLRKPVIFNDVLSAMGAPQLAELPAATICE
jgi:two-component system CheB/CheR fusion protein